MTAQDAKELAENLNEGALPVPISLLSTETVSPERSGGQAVHDGIVRASLAILIGYALYGLVVSLAGIARVRSRSLLYISLMLALFMLIPVTLTAAGIAGFILSIGMAVDANILIFERTKEELRAGKSTQAAIHDGFARAWPSIRDSNISSMITAVILFWFSTSLIQGFALVFGLGVLVSMITAISVSRTFLLALGIDAKHGFSRFLFGSGISH